jgi:hypothetical protein
LDVYLLYLFNLRKWSFLKCNKQILVVVGFHVLHIIKPILQKLLKDFPWKNFDLKANISNWLKFRSSADFENVWNKTQNWLGIIFFKILLKLHHILNIPSLCLFLSILINVLLPIQTYFQWVYNRNQYKLNQQAAFVPTLFLSTINLGKIDLIKYKLDILLKSVAPAFRLLYLGWAELWK